MSVTVLDPLTSPPTLKRNLYAVRSLDYEQIKDFQLTVRALDGGSPPLSSDVFVRVAVVDENDKTTATTSTLHSLPSSE